MARDSVDPFVEVKVLQECCGPETSRRLGLGVSARQLVHIMFQYLSCRWISGQVPWLSCGGRLMTGQVGVLGSRVGGWVCNHHW